MREALRAAAVLTIASVVVCACGPEGHGDPFFPGPVAGVQVTAAGSTTLTSIGATVQLQAAATDIDGNAVLGTTFTWASSDEAVVRVNSSGLVTAVANGTARIVASTDGGVGEVALTVSQAVATIEIELADVVIQIFPTPIALTAVAYDAGGSVIEDLTFMWSLDNPALATLVINGARATVTPLANGVATVTVSAQGVSALIVVTLWVG